jgi:hypothetical protein
MKKNDIILIVSGVGLALGILLVVFVLRRPVIESQNIAEGQAEVDIKQSFEFSFSTKLSQKTTRSLSFKCREGSTYSPEYTASVKEKTISISLGEKKYLFPGESCVITFVPYSSIGMKGKAFTLNFKTKEYTENTEFTEEMNVAALTTTNVEEEADNTEFKWVKPIPVEEPDFKILEAMKDEENPVKTTLVVDYKTSAGPSKLNDWFAANNINRLLIKLIVVKIP